MKRLFVIAAAALFSVGVSAQEYQANFVPYMVTDPSMCPTPDLVTRNKDVRGLAMLIDRQMVELSTSASAQVPEIVAPDRNRINAYIAELEAYQAHINSSDPADYPGTHRLFYCLDKLDEPPVVTSQAINDLLTMMTLMRGELLVSASALLPAGLRVPDNDRLSQHIQGLKNYLTYVDSSAVQDYPRQGAITELIEKGAGITRDQ